MAAALKVSLALGAGAVTAILPDGERTLPLGALPLRGFEDPGPALRQALALLDEALRDRAGEPPQGRVRLCLALLPPLSEARLVELPPLRPEETEAVLRRDAPRHFLGRGRALLVGGERFGEGAGSGSAPVLAAAAGRGLVEALQRAVEARGWEIERIVPAHAAWLRALQVAAPLSGKGGPQAGGAEVRLVVAVEGETAHLIRTAGDAPERIRRVPAHDPAGVVEAAGSPPGRALLLAEGEARSALARALADAGWVLLAAPSPVPAASPSPSPDPAAAPVPFPAAAPVPFPAAAPVPFPAPAEAAGSAAGQAARHAAEASPELVPALLAAARRDRSRRYARRMLAASVVTVAAAAAVHLWGVARQYGAVRSERLELREAVAPVLAARDSLDRMTRQLEAFQSLGGQSARWTFPLVELSMLLPPETHLISLRAAGDTAVVEAAGGRAGDALAALRGAPTLRDVRLEGAIQRDLEGGSTSRERFTLSAVLVRQAAPPPAADRAPEGAAHNGGGP